MTREIIKHRNHINNYNSCMYRLCKVKLKEEYDKWFMTINGELKVYCLAHYERLEKRLSNVG